MAKKNNYVIGIAVTITLSAVFGFLWFAGIDDTLQTSRSNSLDTIPGVASVQ